MSILDHNGKEIKTYADGQNVRISRKTYDKLRKFIHDNGWKIGWFYETAAIEKMEKEIKNKK
jgi:hypothetical protein